MARKPSANDVISSENEPQKNQLRRTDGYYYWEVTSTSIEGNSYGGWRYGPSGSGPATLTFSEITSVNFNIKVTNTITGEYTDIIKISDALGVTIGVGKDRSTSYSIQIKDGESRQIFYRPQFVTYRVVETQFYSIDGQTTRTSNTKVSHVKVYTNWNYKNEILR